MIRTDSNKIKPDMCYHHERNWIKISNLSVSKILGPEYFHWWVQGVSNSKRKLFQRREKDEALLNSFFKSITTLIPKPDKNGMRKETC